MIAVRGRKRPLNTKMRYLVEFAMAREDATSYNRAGLYLVDGNRMNTRIARVLRQNGAKPTAQRMALAEILFSQPQHVCAEDLLDNARDTGMRVSKATIYNTLNLFVRSGLLREINVDANRRYYDSTITPHHHFYNVDTGELVDIPRGSVRLADLPDWPPGTEPAGVELVVKVRQRKVA